jgi:hypothetical protein
VTESGFSDEVLRLHAFFEDWFAGTGDRSLSEFADSLDAGFFLVSPTGRILGRREIIDRIASAFGTGSVEIRIEQPILRHDDAIVIGSYQEHQRRDDARTARITTVAMRRSEDAPGGWSWLSVHETWMPDEPAAVRS